MIVFLFFTLIGTKENFLCVLCVCVWGGGCFTLYIFHFTAQLAFWFPITAQFDSTGSISLRQWSQWREVARGTRGAGRTHSPAVQNIDMGSNGGD